MGVDFFQIIAFMQLCCFILGESNCCTYLAHSIKPLDQNSCIHTYATTLN